MDNEMIFNLLKGLMNGHASADNESQDDTPKTPEKEIFKLFKNMEKGDLTKDLSQIYEILPNLMKNVLQNRPAQKNAGNFDNYSYEIHNKGIENIYFKKPQNNSDFIEYNLKKNNDFRNATIPSGVKRENNSPMDEDLQYVNTEPKVFRSRRSIREFYD